MTSVQSAPGWRKGTISCIECRRRKVRCVRSSEDSAACRQCEARGVACVAQTSSQRPLRTPRLPSRHRIAQLESQVSQLTKIVHGIESKLGGKPSQILTTGEDPNSGHDDSDTESSASEVLVAEQGSHLRSLFQNDWLSVDTNRQEEQLQERRGKAFAHLLDIARPRLQKLIPSRDEVCDISRFAYDWLTMMHLMLPQPFAVRSQSEVLDLYDEMCQPNVDVFALASWLLTVAITAQQIPQGPMDPEDRFRKHEARLKLSHDITNTVETVILSHDRLLGTIQGLGITIHYIRLQIGQGSFQKAWIRLRHVIALAELMGFPKLHQAVRLNRIRSTDDDTSSQKADLWELICNVDRLLGMIMNLAPVTRRCHPTDGGTLVLDGVVQPQVYLRKLMDIAARVHGLDEPSQVQSSSSKLHLELAAELGALASQTPSSWWARGQNGSARPDDVVQFLHYCVTMRVHLPLALRQDAGPEHMYSRLLCTDVCDSVAQRYESLNRILPTGFFVSRLLDLHAFIAAVVLLLSSYSTPSTERNSFRMDKGRLRDVAMRIIHIMSERSKAKISSDFAQEGSSALCALNTFLQQDDNNPTRLQELTVKVPLLGKVHLRRNSRLSRSSTKAGHVQPMSNANTYSGIQNEPPVFAPNEQASLGMDASNTFSPDEWQSNSLSWSIEDGYNSAFEDALMAESIGQSAPWQDMLNFPMSLG